MVDFADLKASIESEHPGWVVWRSDAGRWYATRSGDLTDAQLNAGLAMTLASDDETGLRVQLDEQARTEGA
ncbi:hypothetical protein [Actinocorallia populi]|uniref:hypothetical protein n=1 Tax=Actinocorallia populi TaxID=2079200 RepID=UPI000D089C89|nr:hypothetical protein [Actinocorallia populi]